VPSPNQLQEPASSTESQAEAAERIAYGVLVAALEEGLVTTVQHAIDVLKRFSAPAGPLGEQWLSEQENRWQRSRINLESKKQKENRGK